MSDVPPQANPPHPTPKPPDAGGASPDETQPSDQTRATSELPPTPPAPRPPARTGAAGRARQRTVARRKRRTASVAPVAPPPPAPQPVYPPPAVGVPVRQAHRPATPPSESGLYLPWWSLVVMVGVVGALAFGILFAAMALVQPATLGDQTPQVRVVTAQPTLSQDFGAAEGQAAAPPGAAWPTPIPQLQPTATIPLPTPAPSPTLPPGNFAIGGTVQVVGVDTSGLNIRAAPGLDAQVRFQALEGETFVIMDGPQQVDGFEWWRLEAPNDPNRYGWAVRNYLMATQ